MTPPEVAVAGCNHDPGQRLGCGNRLFDGGFRREGSVMGTRERSVAEVDNHRQQGAIPRQYQRPVLDIVYCIANTVFQAGAALLGSGGDRKLDRDNGTIGWWSGGVRAGCEIQDVRSMREPQGSRLVERLGEIDQPGLQVNRVLVDYI